MKDIHLSNSHAKFLWAIHRLRLNVALARVTREVKSSIIVDVNQIALEAFFRSEEPSELARVVEALERLGPLEECLPELMVAHELRHSEVDFANITLDRRAVALAEQMFFAIGRLVLGLSLATSGLAITLFTIAAALAPTRFGVFETDIDTYELRLLASAPSEGSLLGFWVLLSIGLVGVFALRTGTSLILRTLLRSIVKLSNLIRPWSRQ